MKFPICKEQCLNLLVPAAVLLLATAVSLPAAAQDISGVSMGSSPLFADIDGDGDLDLLLGENAGGPPVNLLANPGAETGDLSGWTITKTGGSGFTVRTSGSAHEGGYVVGTSYNMSTREQVIDLVAAGYSTEVLDAQPDVYVGEWFRAFYPAGGNDKYTITVTLQSSPAGGVLDTWTVSTVTSGSGWNKQSHVFSGYGTGLRYIRFQDGGDDAEYWSGYYGPELDGAYVMLSARADARPDSTVTDGWQTMSSRYNSLQTFGGVTLYRNTGTDSAAAYHLADTTLDVGGAPAVADLDGDGDADLLVGTGDGRLAYYRSDSTAGGRIFTLVDTAWSGIDVAGACRPVLADIDGDGDFDLLTGRADGRIGFYRNTGTAASPYPALVDSQYFNIDVGTNSAPSLVDIDADGDLDLMVGSGAGLLAYYRNAGTVLNPVYVEVDTAFFTIDAGDNLVPAWADLDNDGDYDLYAGRSSGGILRYLNTGTGSAAYFVGAPTAYDFALSAGSHAAPVLADLDADGDNDLLLGAAGGNLVYYRNDGSASSPAWAAPDTAYGSLRIGTSSVPALADVDNDDDLDLFVGKQDGRISFYRNDGSAAVPAWTLIDSNYFNIDAGSYSIPALTDIDGDGDPDLFIGNTDGTMYFYENRGTAAAPLFALAGSAYQGIDVGDNSAPVFTDLDGDGLPDLLVGNSDGAVHAYYNAGTAESAQFVLVSAAYADMYAGSRAVPAPGDLDGDGDADLLLGRGDGYLSWYRNVSVMDEITPDWVEVTASFIDPVASYNAPVWGDVDGDGDLDLLRGKQDGAIAFYLNDGTPMAPACTLVTAEYEGIRKPSYSRPALVDIDADGDLDLFVGGYYGTISFYRNDGTALAPAWNLFDSTYFNIDVGYGASPTFVDIDADGDRDMVVGNDNGTLVLYLNQGTAANPYWTLESSNYASIDIGSNSFPAFFDYDGDGDQDLFIGTNPGTITLYRNDGTAQAASFVLETDAFNNLDVGDIAAPCFADIDGDGKMGLFVGNRVGAIAYWEMVQPMAGIHDQFRDRPSLAPVLPAAGLYDLRGRRVQEGRVRPGMYIRVTEDGSEVVRKVLIH